MADFILVAQIPRAQNRHAAFQINLWYPLRIAFLISDQSSHRGTLTLMFVNLVNVDVLIHTFLFVFLFKNALNNKLVKFLSLVQVISSGVFFMLFSASFT